MIDTDAWDRYDTLVKAADIVTEHYGDNNSIARQLRTLAKEIVGAQ
jgi:hypothetical protein